MHFQFIASGHNDMQTNLFLKNVNFSFLYDCILYLCNRKNAVFLLNLNVECNKIANMQTAQ